jgi:hypothetical protein
MKGIINDLFSNSINEKKHSRLDSEKGKSIMIIGRSSTRKTNKKDNGGIRAHNERLNERGAGYKLCI